MILTDPEQEAISVVRAVLARVTDGGRDARLSPAPAAHSVQSSHASVNGGREKADAKGTEPEAARMQAALDMHELGVRLYRQRMHREHPQRTAARDRRHGAGMAG